MLIPVLTLIIVIVCNSHNNHNHNDNVLCLHRGRRPHGPGHGPRAHARRAAPHVLPEEVRVGEDLPAALAGALPRGSAAPHFCCKTRTARSRTPEVLDGVLLSVWLWCPRMLEPQRTASQKRRLTRRTEMETEAEAEMGPEMEAEMETWRWKRRWRHGDAGRRGPRHLCLHKLQTLHEIRSMSPEIYSCFTKAKGSSCVKSYSNSNG